MKKTFAVALSLFLFGGSLNADTIAAKEADAPLEHKIVELRITFAPKPAAEVKKQRKLMAKNKTGQAICSGSFISPYGHILTARHCVQDATAVVATTYDGLEYRADVLATSKNQDLALIQIGRPNTPFLKVAATNIKGERVRLIGSPLGLTNLITEGIVAKLGGDVVFLDCTGLPGNSGGPVLNQNGEIAGVVSMMVVVILGPAHISIVQSASSIQYFMFELQSGRYNGQR